MSADQYQELIARLEKARTPDRAIDIAILQATDPNGYRIEDDGTILVSGDQGDGPGWFNIGYEVPAFTASIDAALTLVPVTFDYEVMILGTNDNKTWTCASIKWWEERRAINEKGWKNRSANNKGPALALCAAALKVRAAQNVSQSASGDSKS